MAIQAARDKQAQKKLQKKQIESKKVDDAEKKKNASFDSDPCKGKKARFLSTCK